MGSSAEVGKLRPPGPHPPVGPFYLALGLPAGEASPWPLPHSLSSPCCQRSGRHGWLWPGGKAASPAALSELCEELAQLEPEFILKVSLYTRQELNIRGTANFLLALAARLPPCRPHLRRYLCATLQLPSDWIQVVALFQSLAGAGRPLAPLPRCLRAGLADKFQQFDAYQLAKYNSRKSRGKARGRPWPRQPRRELRSPALGADHMEPGKSPTQLPWLEPRSGARPGPCSLTRARGPD
uniref:TROVE domain-containing protein n=1 Tax=Gopherus agassizii TaxID=38772 RepID=A0A452H9Y5_9SAUR